MPGNYDRPKYPRKSKDNGKHGHSRATGPSVYDPIWRDSPNDPSPPGSPSRGPYGPPPYKTNLPDRSRKPPTDGFRDPRGPTGSGSNYYPAARDPYHGMRPPTRHPFPGDTAYKDRAPRFDEKNGVHRRSRELYEEAKLEVSLDTGTEYPCTQRDLDACGGKSRSRGFTDSRDYAELRALWFSEPNRGSKVSIRQASLDIFEHNTPQRIPSAEESDAIDRLRTMLDNALQGRWGPDVAIKCFCDLDIVFFRGKLKGHVCVTWASPKRFSWPGTFGQTGSIGHGKAVTMLNADYILLEPGYWHKTQLNHTIATMLHEMCHAYQFVKCPEHGSEGFKVIMKGPSLGHGKCFGTMMHAVNKRALDVLGVRGDHNSYSRHDYKHGEGFPRS